MWQNYLWSNKTLKTKITTIIDDIEIITGIGTPPNDPEATKAKALAIIADSDIVKSIKSKQSEYQTASTARLTALKAYRTAKTEREKAFATADYKESVAKMTDINSELTELDKSYQSQLRELLINNPEYSIPAPGETIISDTDAEAIEKKIIATAEKGKRLKSDMTEISDYRGAVVWECKNGIWSYRQIITIGDEPTKKEILQENLTDGQIEEIKSQVNK